MLVPSTMPLAQLVFEIVLFLVLTGIGMWILKIKPGIDSKIFNPQEYLPEDEIHTLKQVSYLILMASCFVTVMYMLIYVNIDLLYFTVFDVLLSLYIAVTMDKSTRIRKLFLLLLVPYGALTYLMFGNSLVGVLDMIHIPVLIYFIKVYYDKFKNYTESNGLGITILLLFSIVFFSFLITMFVENANPLDAIVMVSNAFTSNGYAVLGTTAGGKLNSVVLVWSGFIISGVGTATLTAAILSRHFNKKFERLEELINENKKD